MLLFPRGIYFPVRVSTTLDGPVVVTTNSTLDNGIPDKAAVILVRAACESDECNASVSLPAKCGWAPLVRRKIATRSKSIPSLQTGFDMRIGFVDALTGTSYKGNNDWCHITFQLYSKSGDQAILRDYRTFCVRFKYKAPTQQLNVEFNDFSEPFSGHSAPWSSDAELVELPQADNSTVLSMLSNSEHVWPDCK